MQLLVRKPDLGYLDSMLWVPKSTVNVEGTKNALTFQFAEQQKITLLTLWRETEHHLLVPREFWDPKNFAFPVIDCRPRRFPKVDIKSRIALDHRLENGQLISTGKTTQRDAMAALQRSRGGILQVACGEGKTVIALDLVARRGVPAIVILDTTQLMAQWREEIELFLDVPGGVGLIQGDVFDWQKPIVLATYHSLAARAATMPEEVRRWFGTIIWDEAHHVAAPTFSRSADLFYGMRLGLTATPDRDDGMHVVYNFHLGPVIFKSLLQDLKPRIYFIWTGLGLDPNDPAVQRAARDKNGELHIGKVASFLGGWQPRIDFVINQIRQAVANDRKVIVLSKSVDTLINLLAAWNGQQSRVSDIPFPTAQAVGETVPPMELDKVSYRKIVKQLHKVNALIATSPANLATEQARKANIEQALEAHRVYKLCERVWNKQRAEYLKTLLGQPSTAGLMIYKVAPDERTRMLREKQVTFAISKYGREGLNEKSLDTIICNEPLSSRNALQQLMGRVLRKKTGKQDPVVVFLEDDIKPFIGMCQKLRRHLIEWPHDEGGPFDYDNVGHTKNMRRRAWKTDREMFQRTTTVRAPGA